MSNNNLRTERVFPFRKFSYSPGRRTAARINQNYVHDLHRVYTHKHTHIRTPQLTHTTTEFHDAILCKRNFYYPADTRGKKSSDFAVSFSVMAVPRCSSRGAASKNIVYMTKYTFHPFPAHPLNHNPVPLAVTIFFPFSCKDLYLCLYMYFFFFFLRG